MSLPLAGIRVLDLTRALAGPFCTMILGDFGADIVKVEPLPGGDMVRQWGPFAEGSDGDRTGVYYLSVNRNKRSLALDFRKPEALQVLQRLAKDADVIVDNFKPGTMAALGLDDAALVAANPKLIRVSVTGFGQGGPYGDWGGFDQVAQGMAGVMSLTGEVDGQPMRFGLPIGDLTAGMWAALGAMAAIRQRDQTGEGQRVDTSLLGALVGLLCVQGQRSLSLGENPPRAGNDHPVIYPYGVFKTKDGLLNIACATDGMWRSLCDVLGLGELKGDSRFADNAARMKNRAVLRGLIEEKLAARTGADWTRALVEAGIPSGPINTLDQVFADPQVIQQKLVETVAHPTLGPLPQLANPVKMEALAGGSVRTAPPLLGQHSDDILREFGFSDGEIEALRNTKTVG
jgi:crotonobetainyl-CoA:carnitine CoA-transferase CaiB-like acyl-CoA transferase